MELTQSEFVKAAIRLVNEERDKWVIENPDDPDTNRIRNMRGLHSEFSGLEARFQDEFGVPLFDRETAMTDKRLVGPLAEMVEAGIVTVRRDVQQNDRSSAYQKGEFTGYGVYLPGDQPTTVGRLTDEITRKAKASAFAAAAQPPSGLA